MKKRGISPLIATVLIIGFTIILAAMVMQWGGGLFEKIKGESGESAEKALACSKINLNIINAKTDFFNSKTEISIENLAEQKISGFLVRLIGENGGDVTNNKTELNIGEVKKISSKFNIVKTGLVNNVEIFPKISINNKEFTCENKIIKKILNYDPNDKDIEKIWRVLDDSENLPLQISKDNTKKFSGDFSWSTPVNSHIIWNNQNGLQKEVNVGDSDYFIFAFTNNGGVPIIYFKVDGTSQPNRNYHIGAFGLRPGPPYCGPPGGWWGWGCVYFSGSWKLTIMDLNAVIAGERPKGYLTTIGFGDPINSVSYGGWYDTMYFYKIKK